MTLTPMPAPAPARIWRLWRAGRAMCLLSSSQGQTTWARHSTLIAARWWASCRSWSGF